MRTQRPGQSALLFLDVLDVLQREQIPYAVIGAFALSVHGTIRGTTDVDALLFAPLLQLETLRTSFADAGLRAELRLGDAEDPIVAMLVIRDAFDNRVELLGGLRGMDRELFSRTLKVPFLGVDLRIVGLEDFIALKCFAGGPQDVHDAKAAYQGARGPINLDLLRMITRRFGREAADKLEDVLKV